MSVVTAVVAMVITVYVPLAGGINGGGAITRSGVAPLTGMAACGWQHPFGTVFEVVGEDMSKWGLPQVVVCMDRGGYVGPMKLDLALVSPDVKDDINRAKQWGKRTRDVRVHANLDAYYKANGIDPTHPTSITFCKPNSKCATHLPSR